MIKQTKSTLKNPIVFFLFTCFFFTTCKPSVVEETSESPKKPPNVIFILVDDMGYGDLGILFQNQRKTEGKPYHCTPELDQMAAEGAVLTRHYAPAPVCAPSRASLLSGLHQGHQPIRNNQFDKALANNHTLASVLKAAGYATAIVGKYGLQGQEGNSPSAWEAYPTKRGFDYFFGYVRHVDGHNHYPAHQAPNRPPMELYENDREISQQLAGCYTTDLFTAVAKKWIVAQRRENPENPFFLYLAYNTPHAGLQVAPGPYPEGKGLNGGVQVLENSPYFINAASEPVDTYIHPEYRQESWPMVQQRSASMMRRIDEAIGDLLQLLKDLEIDEETMVVFTSDNGPHHESYGYGDYDPTFFESYGPLDGTKRDTWEGCIRVPTLVRWPKTIPANQFVNRPSAFHDWLPTLAELAQVPAPANTDGVSLLPSITGKGTQLPGKVYIEYSVNMPTKAYASFQENRRGITRGEMQVVYHEGYKGVRYNTTSHANDFEIYDTQSDPGERNNLAGSSPEFITIQQGMKDKVLRMRRSDPEAARPYDAEPVPPVQAPGKLTNGLLAAWYQAPGNWVPAINSLRSKALKAEQAADLAIPSPLPHGQVVHFTGFLDVPVTGTYQFTLTCQGKAVGHLHDILWFDADLPYTPGDNLQTTLVLAAGLHPFRFIYRPVGGLPPALAMTWENKENPGLPPLASAWRVAPQ